MQPIDLLIFDLDGTLANTLPDIAASVNYTLGRLGQPLLAQDTVRNYVGDGIANLMERSLGGRRELVAEAISIYKDHHRRNLVVHSSLYPSVRETLAHFQAIPMAVISNKTKEFVDPLLSALGLERFFKMVIGADLGLPLKPAPDSIQRIMGAYDARKERTVMVGDGTTDILAGKAAGIITCAVTYGFRSEEELRKAGPDHMIRAFSELTTIFRPER